MGCRACTSNGTRTPLARLSLRLQGGFPIQCTCLPRLFVSSNATCRCVHRQTYMSRRTPRYQCPRPVRRGQISSRASTTRQLEFSNTAQPSSCPTRNCSGRNSGLVPAKASIAIGKLIRKASGELSLLPRSGSWSARKHSRFGALYRPQHALAGGTTFPAYKKRQPMYMPSHLLPSSAYPAMISVSRWTHVTFAHPFVRPLSYQLSRTFDTTPSNPVLHACLGGGVLIYCHCGHHIALDADRWPDDVRLSDLEPRFVYRGCGGRGADARPDIERATRGSQSWGTETRNDQGLGAAFRGADRGGRPQAGDVARCR